MRKPVYPCAHGLVVLSLLGLMGCYSTVEVGDSPADKAISIDWVDPPCAVPGSEAGYIEGTGFGAENVTITVGGIPAEVLAATGMDASFVVPERLEPDESIEVVVENPGGRIATIDWVVCGPGPDLDPPILTNFDINPKTVDVSNGDAVVMCEMSFTDAGSGMDHVQCDITSPTGLLNGCFTTAPPQSGDSFDGTWSCPVVIPQGAESGVWEVRSVYAKDAVGNPYSTYDLQTLGFPNQFDVVSTNEDLDPPILTNFDINPKTVDVSNGDAVVMCEMSFTDAGSGIDHVQCDIRSPTGLLNGCFTTAPPQSGDSFDGTWSCPVVIPQGAESGVWEVNRVYAKDAVGNPYSTYNLQTLGFPNQFDVVSTNEDLDPPILTNFDINPKTVDVSNGDAVVMCEMSFTDAGSGMDHVQCDIRSPTGLLNGCFTTAPPQSGDSFDGTWSCPVVIPQGAESGVWEVNRVYAKDAVGNPYSTYDLQTLGFPNQFDVTYGP